VEQYVTEQTESWFKSSFCSDAACVEVAPVGRDVRVRDGKNADQHVLRFSQADWNAFLDKITAGEYRSL
jgi:hypothetical protein